MKVSNISIRKAAICMSSLLLISSLGCKKDFLKVPVQGQKPVTQFGKPRMTPPRP